MRSLLEWKLLGRLDEDCGGDEEKNDSLDALATSSSVSMRLSRGGEEGIETGRTTSWSCWVVAGFGEGGERGKAPGELAFMSGDDGMTAGE